MVEIRRHVYQTGVHTPVVQSADPVVMLQEYGDEIRLLHQKLKTFGKNVEYDHREESGHVYVGNDPEIKRLEDRIDHVGKQSVGLIRTYLLNNPALDLGLLIPFPNEYIEKAVMDMPDEDRSHWARNLGITISKPAVHRNIRRR